MEVSGWMNPHRRNRLRDILNRPSFFPCKPIETTEIPTIQEKVLQNLDSKRGTNIRSGVETSRIDTSIRASPP